MARKSLVLQVSGLACTVDLHIAQGKSDEDLVTVCVGSQTGGHPPTKVNMKRHCATCASEVQFADLKKASVTGKSSFTLVDQNEVKAVRDSTLEVTGQMLQVTLHDRTEAERATLPSKGSSTYYLAPSSAAQIGKYSLILDLLSRHPEIAARVVYTPVSKPGLYEVAVFDGVLALKPLSWPEEIKPVPITSAVEPTPEMQVKLDALAAKTVQTFDASAYRNTYAEALVNLLATKTSEDGIVPTVTTTTPAVAVGASVNLDALLDELLA